MELSVPCSHRLLFSALSQPESQHIKLSTNLSVSDPTLSLVSARTGAVAFHLFISSAQQGQAHCHHSINTVEDLLIWDLANLLES